MGYHTMPCNTMESIKSELAQSGPFWAQKCCFGPKSKMAQKSDFYAFHCIAWHRMVLHGIALYLMVSHSFHVIPLYRMVLHGIVLYLTVLHGIALLASACGLYPTRHLSTLSNGISEEQSCRCMKRLTGSEVL